MDRFVDRVKPEEAPWEPDALELPIDAPVGRVGDEDEPKEEAPSGVVIIDLA